MGPWSCSCWYIEGRKWGEDTSPGGTSLECPYTKGDVPQLHHLFPACQEGGDPLTDNRDTVIWGGLEGMVLLVKLWQDIVQTIAYCIVH